MDTHMTEPSGWFTYNMSAQYLFVVWSLSNQQQLQKFINYSAKTWALLGIQHHDVIKKYNKLNHKADKKKFTE